VTVALNLDQHEIWHDNAPAAAEADMITNWDSVHTVCISAGENIQLDVLVADLTNIGINLYVLWAPLSANGNVVGI